MGCPSLVFLGDTVVFSVCTHDPDTGELTDADSVPAYRVYEAETAVAILSGSMAKLDDANTTGFYTESIAATTANGFEAGKSYNVYISATVDSDTGGIAYSFSIAAHSYIAKVTLLDDDDGSRDRYTVAWYKDGQAVTSGITSPTIQIVKAADGSDLVAAAAMSAVTGGLYTYAEATNRITSGVAYAAILSATIDGAVRTSYDTAIGRDT